MWAWLRPDKKSAPDRSSWLLDEFGKEPPLEVYYTAHHSSALLCNDCTLGWKSIDSVPKLVDDYLAKKVKLDEFISHTLPWDQINEAFTLMHKGER